MSPATADFALLPLRQTRRAGSVVTTSVTVFIFAGTGTSLLYAGRTTTVSSTVWYFAGVTSMRCDFSRVTTVCSTFLYCAGMSTLAKHSPGFASGSASIPACALAVEFARSASDTTAAPRMFFSIFPSTMAAAGRSPIRGCAVVPVSDTRVPRP